VNCEGGSEVVFIIRYRNHRPDLRLVRNSSKGEGYHQPYLTLVRNSCNGDGSFVYRNTLSVSFCCFFYTY
jgi:hypothetical protein